ncbi:hypothetical protein [Oceanobacillus sojae]|uniref:hypothetical protein n=1 Tax=Oceanobacillus sojae TaxID=582851 RepID=UPI00363443B4
MKQKIVKAGYFVVLAVLLITMAFMANALKEWSAENQQLNHINAELQLEYYKMQIQRDEAVDAVWSNNHRQMKESAD